VNSGAPEGLAVPVPLIALEAVQSISSANLKYKSKKWREDSNGHEELVSNFLPYISYKTIFFLKHYPQVDSCSILMIFLPTKAELNVVLHCYFSRGVLDTTLCEISDLWRVGDFLWVFRFPPPIKPTVTI
jgi:hypothetical protein